jgi:cytochrome c
MPNRNGMTTDHGLWPGKGLGNGGKPDVPGHGLHDATAPPRPRWPRFLPDHARNAHGNLAEQNRLVGRAARRRHHAPGPAARRRQPRVAAAPAAAAPTAPAGAAPRSGSAPRRPLRPALVNVRCAACHAVRPQGASGPGMTRGGAQHSRPAPTRSDYLAGKIVGGAGRRLGPGPDARRRSLPRADARPGALDRRGAGCAEAVTARARDRHD